MVFVENVRQFFKDHPELYGDDPTVPFNEFLATVDPESLDGSANQEEDLEGFVRTTKITSGEVARILGNDRFDVFGRDLELPQHRAIIARAFA